MQECIKACLSNTANIQDDVQEEIVPMDDMTNTTVSESGEGIWYRIAHLNTSNPRHKRAWSYNMYLTYDFDVV